jgi:hypothetical protein
MFKSRHLGNLYLYSLGRYALKVIFSLINVRQGQSILLPRLICREVVDCIKEFGAQPVYYDVTRQNLMPEISESNYSSARAVILVNYFGFPQDISQYSTYKNNSSVVWIEDNAHGYLSRDGRGEYLGMRADYGVFSPRKTLTIPNGGMLYIRHKDRVNLPRQPECTSANLSYKQSLKKLLRKCNGWGNLLLGGILLTKRLLRILGLPGQNSDSGLSALEVPINPWSGLKETLETLDEKRESSRRRALYIQFEQELDSIGYEKVFEKLPTLCVPYGFPFYSDDSRIGPAVAVARKHGLGVMKWPDLPDFPGGVLPLYYRKLYLINFQV